MIGRWSRYQWCDIETDEVSRRYFTERPVFSYRDLPENRLHVVTEGQRLWQLCQLYYPNIPRNGTLFWVVADFQPEPILDPTLDLKAGTLLVIPSEATVESLVFAGARRSFV